VPITGPDGNIMAEIKANGQNLGTITSSFYKNSNAIRASGSSRYLDRNITITPQTQPSSAVGIRLYLSTVEFEALKADPLSMISTITDLKILKNGDNCGPSLTKSTTFVTVTHAATQGTSGYVVQGNINSFSTFYFSSAAITLPLELLTFGGKLENNATVLDWETTNEINTDKFVVERSIDGRSFNNIGSVTAHGNTASKTAYSFIDVNAVSQPSPILYYRLKMMDRDGKFTYSNTINILLENITGRLTLAPNPASHEVKATITVLTEGRAKWQLIDNSGRVVLNGSVLLKPGKNILPISINNLKGGAYYLTVSGAGIDQKVKLQKF
jgi:hypothetical protein